MLCKAMLMVSRRVNTKDWQSGVPLRDSSSKRIANICNLSRMVSKQKNDGSRSKYLTSKRISNSIRANSEIFLAIFKLILLFVLHASKLNNYSTLTHKCSKTRNSLS